MVVGLLTGQASRSPGYYLVFMLVDLLVALLAFVYLRTGKAGTADRQIPQRQSGGG